MSYIVYTNKNNSPSTIHLDENCNQIKKNSGGHKYNQGNYGSFETSKEAEQYYNSRLDHNKNKIIYCSYCESEK